MRVLQQISCSLQKAPRQKKFGIGNISFPKVQNHALKPSLFRNKNSMALKNGGRSERPANKRGKSPLKHLKKMDKTSISKTRILPRQHTSIQVPNLLQCRMNRSRKATCFLPNCERSLRMAKQREISPIIIYQTEDGTTKLEVRLEDEKVWLSQKLMAELFQKDIRTINEHLRNIFEERELIPDSVIRNFRITAADGKAYTTQHYNLDVIISVGKG
jgi:hypothetical protein